MMLTFPAPGNLSADFFGVSGYGFRFYNGETTEKLDLSSYMDYCERQWKIMAEDGFGQYITIRSYRDIVDIIHLISKGNTRESIISSLQNRYPNATEDAIENSVNLSANLLLMIKLGVIKHQVVPRGFISWEHGSLNSLIQKQFSQPQVLDCHSVRLPKSFNAWAINAIGGLQVEFTNNLADHLLLVDYDTKILIFHHASFLECQLKSLFPEGLADETLRTLALLFPQSEFNSLIWGGNKKKAWFRKLCSNFQPYSVDHRVIRCGSLRAEERQIEHFNFWRDRLIILKQTYDDATPKTLSQLWHDRRNGERFYTFWIAVLVFIITTTLGVIQCIEGGLQVYKAYSPTPH